MLLYRHVFGRQTIEAIESLPLHAQRVADRWAAGWKDDSQALEVSGVLLDRLKVQADYEAAVLADARVGGENAHLTDHEILALYDVAPWPPAP